MSKLQDNITTLNATSAVSALAYTHAQAPGEIEIDVSLSGLVSSGEQTYTLVFTRGGIVFATETVTVADGDTSAIRRYVWGVDTGEVIGMTIVSTSASDTAIQSRVRVYGEQDVAEVSSTALTPGPLATTKRVAVLARVTRASIGQAVDFGLTGQTTKTVTVTDDYENDSSGQTMAVSTFFDVPADTDIATLTATVVPSAASTATVQAFELVDADPAFGCVPLALDSQHAGPTAAIWNEKLAVLVSEAGSARRHLMVDEQPWGELFADVPDNVREPNDRYHQSSALAVAGDVLVAVMTDHLGEAWFTYGRTAQELRARASIRLSQVGELVTYVNAVGFADGSAYVTARVDTGIRLWSITGLDTDSPTVVTRVPWDSGTSTKRTYPRGMFAMTKDDGSPLVGWGYQLRGVAAWTRAGACVFDPSNGLIYDLAGNTNGNTSLGTPASPILDFSTEVENTTFATAGVIGLIGAYDSENGHRYHGPMAMRAIQWGPSGRKAEVLSVFADVDDLPLGTAGAPVFRILHYDGTTRTVTATDDDPFGLDGGASFRFSVLPRFTLNSDTAEVVIGVRSAAFSGDDDYFGFGSTAADGFEIYSVALPSLAVRKLGDLLVTSDAITAEVRRVEGSDGCIISEEYLQVAEMRGVARHQLYGLPVREQTAVEETKALATLVRQDTGTAIPAAITGVDTVVTDLQTNAISNAAAGANSALATQGLTNAGNTIDTINTNTQASAQQTAAEAAIDAKLPSNATEIAGAGASATTLDQVSGGGGGGGTVTAEDIARHLTWRFEGAANNRRQSTNRITVDAGVTVSVGTPLRLQFDLHGSLETDATVASAGVASVAGGTFATSELHTSKRRVIVPITSLPSAGTHTVTLSYTATDAQPWTVTGTLVVV